MGVYLIQTSGADITSEAKPAYISGAEGPRFCDEPLQHNRYFNAEPYWQQGFARRRAWQTAAKDDIALLYCTGSVDGYSSSLSHALPIAEKRIVDGEGAWLEFDKTIELEPTIDYPTIQSKIDDGEFSDGMGRCGQEGFNFRRVEDDDLQTVQRLTTPTSGVWDDVL
ncbi:hypothetical protein [Halorussus sp. AFM4]|uniref:hypothetical protein n=1 Tax=Halorussus sp. AFM4 TaxID=3421651 RepID=UPI003EC073DE